MVLASLPSRHKQTKTDKSSSRIINCGGRRHTLLTFRHLSRSPAASLVSSPIMYNGIGLQTARGSGTNGYVVRNLSHIRPRDNPVQYASLDDFKNKGPTVRQPNQEILMHDRKREVEIKCIRLRTELEEQNLAEEDIEQKVDEFRKELLTNLEKVQLKDVKNLQEHETHQLSQAKAAENTKMMRAFNINHDNYVEGAAFDRELQERKKQERVARRAAEEEARRQQAAAREKEMDMDRKTAAVAGPGPDPGRAQTHACAAARPPHASPPAARATTPATTRITPHLPRALRHCHRHRSAMPTATAAGVVPPIKYMKSNIYKCWVSTYMAAQFIHDQTWVAIEEDSRFKDI
ncbi:hypothetical protein BC937DRAFT_89111, partial [Endogone sp. FLAS-F59071]